MTCTNSKVFTYSKLLKDVHVTLFPLFWGDALVELEGGDERGKGVETGKAGYFLDLHIRVLN